jgi:hypothetical protein
VTSYGCLGEDIAGTLRVWATPAEVASSDLMRAMFGKKPGDDLAGADLLHTTPLQAKKGLDRALLDAGVVFFTGAYATDLLTDTDGKVSGARWPARLERPSPRSRPGRTRSPASSSPARHRRTRH